MNDVSSFLKRNTIECELRAPEIILFLTKRYLIPNFAFIKLDLTSDHKRINELTLIWD